MNGRALAGIVLLGSGMLLPGCATVQEAAPALAEVGWVDLRRDVRSTLVSKGYGDFDELRRTGRLDPSIKIIEPEEMGSLIEFMEQHGFFERATPVSPDSSQLREKTNQLISLRRGNQVLSLVFQVRPGGDPEMQAWDRDFVAIKLAINEIFRNTVQFTLVPHGRSR